MSSPLRTHLAETWRSRDLVLQLGRRDIRLRYRQTRLGLLWLVIGPLVSAATFTFVFNRIGKISTDSNTPYFVFAFTGLVAWTLFFQVTTRVSMSFLSSAMLVTRVRFPRLALPTSILVGGGADAGVGLAIAVVGATATHPRLWLLPGVLAAAVCLALIALLAWTLGLLIALLAVRRRDLVQGLPIILQLGLFATPIAYPPSAVPNSLRLLVDANPVATGIGGFRFFLLGEPAPTISQVLIALGLLGLGLIGALALFRKVEPCMADVL